MQTKQINCLSAKEKVDVGTVICADCSIQQVDNALKGSKQKQMQRNKNHNQLNDGHILAHVLHARTTGG